MGERPPPKATILNVNDHPATLYMVSHMLRMAGYQVLEASNGKQALSIAAGRPDLVLLDVHLPDIDGYEVCRRLRAQDETRDLLIAHLSAVSVQREDRIRGLAHGADAYWTTPMEEEELLSNIEALLRLQGRAQGAIRERDEFLSVAAHELKTPLTALRLHLERTLYLTTRGATETLPKPTVEKSLTPALRQIDRLQQLLDTLLDVSRVTSHKLRLDISALDLVELAGDLALRLEAQARAVGVELQFELPHEPIILFGDKLRLEQVLTNLVTNAIKYGGGRPVEIRVEERPTGPCSPSATTASASPPRIRPASSTASSAPPPPGSPRAWGSASTSPRRSSRPTEGPSPSPVSPARAPPSRCCSPCGGPSAIDAFPQGVRVSSSREGAR